MLLSCIRLTAIKLDIIVCQIRKCLWNICEYKCWKVLNFSSDQDTYSLRQLHSQDVIHISKKDAKDLGTRLSLQILVVVLW